MREKAAQRFHFEDESGALSGSGSALRVSDESEVGVYGVSLP